MCGGCEGEVPEVDTVDSLKRVAKADMEKMNAQLSRDEVWSIDSDRIAELKSEWEHASRIAFESIGQPDRAANVAYRDELWRRICEARGEYDGDGR